AYKVVTMDDEVLTFGFEYKHENVEGLPEQLGAEIDYEAVWNEERETWYIKVTVENEEALNTDNIKKIRTIKSAGELVDPVELTVLAGDPYLWFGVADKLGLPTLKQPGLYA